MIKKKLVLCLAILMVFFIAGCGKKENINNTNNNVNNNEITQDDEQPNHLSINIDENILSLEWMGAIQTDTTGMFGPSLNMDICDITFKANKIGSNDTSNVIKNGDQIILPEGTALVTVKDGVLTGLATQAGMYTFKGKSNQLAFYINLKYIPNNKFGMPNEIFWNDYYYGTLLQANYYGTYTIQIIDPLLIIKNLITIDYFTESSKNFNMNDEDSDLANMLFNQVGNANVPILDKYSNEYSTSGLNIVNDHQIFATMLNDSLEDSNRWNSVYGIKISDAHIDGFNLNESYQAFIEAYEKEN